MAGKSQSSGTKGSTSRSPTPKSKQTLRRSPRLKPADKVLKDEPESSLAKASSGRKRSRSASKSPVLRPKKTPPKKSPQRAPKETYAPQNQEMVDKAVPELKMAPYEEPLPPSAPVERVGSQAFFSPAKPVNCPYLGTINRHLLDFDFEKVCSITLTNIHVYACLVCGKYFQGRGKNTYCYTHALEQGHYLFMNLEDCNVYCIPENYQVDDASLDDIKHFLKPVYTRKDVENLSKHVTYGKALDGTDFIPGCIGLNNLKSTDYFNVIIQLMCSVVPLRNLFLLFDVNKVQPPDQVITSLAQLVRKIFNTKNFKGIVSPHEFVQAVAVASNGVYKIGVQSDPVSLLSWVLARVHQKLQNKNTKESVVTKTFGGQLVINTLKGTRWETERRSFRMLSLNVPEAPIFKDSVDTDAIPQVPIFELLRKYDGNYETVGPDGSVSTYKISRLPEYLIVVIKRFTKNNYFMEKNPTIVSFPMKNLDLADYVDDSIKGSGTRYDLLCNVAHEGTPNAGTFRIQMYHPPSGNWFQVEDLLVTSILPQQVALTESYLQVYRRQESAGGADEDLDMFA